MAERRVLYLDLVGGAAGDMIMAALLDLGAPLAVVEAAVAAMGLTEVKIEVREVMPAGLRARQVDVLVRGRLADTAPERGGHEHGHGDADHHHGDHAHGHEHGGAHHHEDHAHGHEHGGAHHHGVHAHGHEHGGAHHHGVHAHGHEHGGAHHHGPHAHAHGGHTHRPYRVIRDLLEAAPLSPRVKALASAAFARLGEAESRAHGVPLEEVEFHEVGSDDAITDVVGVAAALEALAIDEVVVSPVPLGRGLTRGAHGPIPLPGPAVLHLLAGVPVEETPLRGETVTPTGAALLTAMADRFGPVPSFSLEAVGVGAGHRSWPDRPNVVRAILGRQVREAAAVSEEDCVLEANLDDMSPELLPELERALFEAGSFDVWTAPIHMKKGRTGVLVSALARRTLTDVVAAAFFTHSTTLGLRVTPVTRLRAPREMREVVTPHGTVRVKLGPRPEGPPLVAPEHDDCARVARERGLPLRVVYEAALRAAWAAGLGD